MDKTPKRLVIVGGVAAGASAAAKARRMSEEIEIVLIEAGPYISFANCGLPYYVGGEIGQREKLFVTDADGFGRRFRVDVRTGCRAVEVDPERRLVKLEARSANPRELAYDRLILATGTVPVRPPIPGLDSRSVFTVRTVPDVDAIRARVKSLDRGQDGPGTPGRALVMGGGYIGLEAAEQLLHLGFEVALVERAPQIMLSMDPEMAYPLQVELEAAGVRMIVGDGVAEVIETEDGPVARTEQGRELPFDLGIMALGVRPAVELARQMGLRLGVTGAIEVDAAQRTSDPRVFAAGDNCEAHHRVLGRPVNIPLAGPANKMGRIAGANAALDLTGAAPDDPRRMRFQGVLGTAVVRVLKRYAATTGLTEKLARDCGIAAQVVYMAGGSHAGYYPNSEPLLLKVLSDPESGRLLGAQAVGGEGVDKRVDVLATAVSAGLRIEDLEQLDLCYAPPVGAARDVAIMLGFAGENARRGLMPSMTPGELFEELAGPNPPAVVDVRTHPEFTLGHVAGALNIPVDDLRDRLQEVPVDRPLVLYCRSGYRSYVAQRILLNRGWTEVRNVQGGYMLVEQTLAARNAGRSAGESAKASSEFRVSSSEGTLPKSL